MRHSRREFLTALVAAVPALAVPPRIFAATGAARALSFNHLHTGERLAVERDFRTGEGVAAGSPHVQGQAIDIRLADVPLAKLLDAARAVRLGGVGYYPASDFVHVDTGRVRTW